MVNHVCQNCNKSFNRKSNYDYHINNKKNPCNPNLNKLCQTQNKLIDPPKNLINNIIKNNNLIEENINLCCDFCGAIFNRRDNLKRHMDKFCKVKKLQDEEKENIFKILLAKEEEIKKKDEETKKKDEENKKHITKLEDYIKKLTDMNLDLNNKVTKLIEKVSVQNINKGVINNNNVNNNTNIIIGTDKLCNFGFEDLQIINPSLFNNLYGKFGKEVFIECVKNIYNNEPKNKTLYISDLSREKCMAFENNNWNLISLQKAINTVEAQIRKYFKHNEKYFKEKLKDQQIKEKYEKQVKKWYKMYYDEYDEDDKNEPSEARLLEFHQVVNTGLTEFFYNIREDVKSNHEKIKNKVMDDTLLKQIKYEPPKKGRGRPKKAETIVKSIQNDPEINNNLKIKINKSTKSTNHVNPVNPVNPTNPITSNDSEDIKEFIMNLMNKEKGVIKSKAEFDSDELVPIGRPRSQKLIDRDAKLEAEAKLKAESEGKIKQELKTNTTTEFKFDPNLRPAKFTGKSNFERDSDNDSDDSSVLRKRKKDKKDKKKDKKKYK